MYLCVAFRVLCGVDYDCPKCKYYLCSLRFAVLRSEIGMVDATRFHPLPANVGLVVPVPAGKSRTTCACALNHCAAVRVDTVAKEVKEANSATKVSLL